MQSEYPELKLAGYVEDLGSFLKGSVAVVPIRIGSGMRMKILDAVLSKVPFVTTAKGVEGIDFKDGEDCLIVDDPAGFGLSGNFWLVSFKISYLCLPLFYETRTTPSCHPSGCAYRQL